MKNNKNKIDFFRLFLYFLLGISLFLYFKLYISVDVNIEVVDLPVLVTNTTWYEYESLNTLKFSSGTVNYSDTSNSFSSCNKYSYDKENKLISFDCNNYSMRLVSVTAYKMIVVLSGSNIKSEVFIYYNSLDLINYLKSNNLENLSDEEIAEIMEEERFKVDKGKEDDEYKNAQLSKLSAIEELTIDGYYSLKKSKDKFIVLLINANMSIDSYDLIPIYLSWENIYKDYDFYYMNGSNLRTSDYDLLDKDDKLKKYLIGLDDNNILIFDNGEYKRVSVEIDVEETEMVFNCIDDCSEVELKIYDDENVYESIDDVINNE